MMRMLHYEKIHKFLMFSLQTFLGFVRFYATFFLGVNKMKKIAIVDSGIDLYKDKVIQHLDFSKNRSENRINNHGNLCCSALLSINSDVEIYDIKVLNEFNCCSTTILLEALEYINNTEIDIINLSLASHQKGYINKYKTVIKQLCDNGKVIVASLSNNGQKSIPANLPNTIGVSGNIFIKSNTYWYNKKLDIQCIADDKPLLLKSCDDGYDLFGGNSKATAIFTGMLAYYCDRYPYLNYDSLQNVLMQYAKKTFWDKVEEEDMDCTIKKYNDKILKNLIDIVKTSLKINSTNEELLYNGNLYLPGLNRFNAIILIRNIEEFFNISFDYKKINIFWFYSLQNLYYMVYKELNTIHEKREI